VHLQGRLDWIVDILDVGVATANVRYHHAILAPQPGDQLVRGVRIVPLVRDVRRISDLCVLGPVNGSAFMAIVHIAVAAHGRVRRPFIAWYAHATAGPVELLAQCVELPPDRGRDLEIVALVAHDVQEGLIAAELEY